MRIAIVEDEAMAARRLSRLTALALGIKQDDILMLDNLGDASEKITLGNTDLILLDLDLAGKDGFDLLRNREAIGPKVIVVSANTDRALEAFDYDVVDFVPKPVSSERLKRALKRARDTEAGEARITIRSQGKMDIVPVATVTHVSGADDYVEVHTSQGEMFLHYDRLDHLEKILSPGFVRVHRSHIVKGKFVSSIQTGQDKQSSVILETGFAVPVSRRRMKLVRDAIS